MDQIVVKEIFYSIQGESSFSGWPTVFVRLAGCPLRCSYCDTAYAFFGGFSQSIDAVLKQVKSHGAQHITVTGGEPLAQKGCVALLQQLCDLGYTVSLETSGAFSIEHVHPDVLIVMDVKTPSSGEQKRFFADNINFLKPSDDIKFVISDIEDYNWSYQFASENKLFERFCVFASPVYECLKAGELADWILKDKAPFRLQVQLHKYLWGDVPGR